MLVIRLQRRGKKKQAFFRVVLQEKTWQPKGKAIEILGFYNPHTKEKNFQGERINYWVSRGAQMTPMLHNLLVDAKVIDGPKVQAYKAKPKPKSSEALAKEEKKEEFAEVSVEAPFEEKAESKPQPKAEEPEKTAEPEAKEEAVKAEDVKSDAKKNKSAEAPTPPEEGRSPDQNSDAVASEEGAGKA